MFKNLVGQKFGKLLVLNYYSKDKNNKVLWNCVCDCGNTTIVRTNDLKSNKVKSCGCYRDCATIKRSTKHNKSHTRLYRIYYNMISRCYNTNNDQYINYGGRNIKICDKWLNDFNSFYNWSINNGYESDLTIDRIDNDCDYEPSNCRWTDIKTQSLNRRTNRYITYKNETLTIKEWSDKLNIPYTRIYARLYRGCPIEKILSK